MESKIIITPDMDEHFKKTLEFHREGKILAKDADEHDKKLFEIAKEFMGAHDYEYKDIDDFGTCCCVKRAGQLTAVSVRTKSDIDGEEVLCYYAFSEDQLKQLLKD